MNNIILKIKDLTVSFKEKKILKQINLIIKKKEIISLLGLNGARKKYIN